MVDVADAALPLQKAIVATLKNDAAVSNLISGRIYDHVPDNALLPYASLGPVDVLPEQAQEYDGSDSTVQIDAWSATPGMIQIKQIGRAIRAALDETNMPLDENHRIVAFDIETTRYLTEADGITKHAVLIFRARTEPTD